MIAAGGLGAIDVTGWTFVAMAMLLFLSFFFSGTETALFSLQPLDRLAMARGGYSSRLAVYLLGKRREILPTILIGNETVNVALAATSAAAVAMMLPDYPWANVFILTPVLVLVSEITPKVLALRFNQRWARVASWPLAAFFFVITPLRLVFSLLVAFIARRLGARGEILDEGLAEADLMNLVDEGAAAGEFDQMERDIIEAVFEFDELTVERVMTPRPDIDSLPTDLTWDELLARCRKLEHSRIPMYADEPDNIVGILLLKDLLKHRNTPLAGPRQLRSILLPANFVPASKAADSMLQEFLKRRSHMALVVDEHGTLTGLVTLDDLLDELIGELAPDTEDSEVARISPTALTVKAGMDIEDFTEETGIELPEGDYHTVGGFVFHEFGSLPRRGDSIELGPLKFVVAEMEGRRIGELRIIGVRPKREVS